MRTAHELVIAGIAIRQLRTKAAWSALARAEHFARDARIPALMAEVESARAILNTPAARLLANGQERLVRLEEVEGLLASKSFVVDAFRLAIRDADATITLARRPVLFSLAHALAKAWPRDVTRDTLVAGAFGGIRADASHRARLRVEIGRLRAALRPIAVVGATKQGFALSPRSGTDVVVLEHPADDAAEHGAVLALLADGEAWSSSALALAMSVGQRRVQRALEALLDAGKVQFIGRGRGRRWITTPMPGFATTLLLPGPLSID